MREVYRARDTKLDRDVAVIIDAGGWGSAREVRRRRGADRAISARGRLTLAPGIDGIGVWMPDSRRVIFSSDRAGVRNLFQQAADGTVAVERLTESCNTQ